MSETNAFQLQRAKRQTLGENVAVLLREAIFKGEFRPGERLTEGLIASRLDVSRAPIRDALARLEQEGLISRTSRRRAFVSILSPEDVEEIVTLRLPLEVLAVRLATRKATKEQLAQLAENIDAEARAETADQLAVLDLQFHDLLVRAAKHKRLLSTWLNLSSQVRLLMVRRNLVARESQPTTVQVHTELLKAMRARNEDRAAALMEEQMQSFLSYSLAAFADDAAAG